ncbi:MAG: NTF2-like N-terminal transpeptidase domain-containing protein, partial [Anaerolineales bacterium]
MSIRLVRWWLLSVLLVACTSAPETPTPQPTAPPATPTPAPTNTPVPTPEGTAQAYFAAWQQGDYADMYALLTPESQAALAAADFEKQYRDNLLIMSATALTPTVTSVNQAADEAQVLAHLTYSTQLVGALETDITLPLKHTGQSWGVVYSPAVIWPELVDGKQLYMVPFTPDRGVIYDREGVPMVQNADVYAVGLVPGEVTPEAEEAVITGLARLTGISTDALVARYQIAVPEQYMPVAEALVALVDERFGYLFNLPGVR